MIEFFGILLILEAIVGLGVGVATGILAYEDDNPYIWHWIISLYKKVNILGIVLLSLSFVVLFPMVIVVAISHLSAIAFGALINASIK